MTVLDFKFAGRLPSADARPPSPQIRNQPLPRQSLQAADPPSTISDLLGGLGVLAVNHPSWRWTIPAGTRRNRRRAPPRQNPQNRSPKQTIPLPIWINGTIIPTIPLPIWINGTIIPTIPPPIPSSGTRNVHAGNSIRPFPTSNYPNPGRKQPTAASRQALAIAFKARNP
jgi:hypothetical protein